MLFKPWYDVDDLADVILTDRGGRGIIARMDIAGFITRPTINDVIGAVNSRAITIVSLAVGVEDVTALGLVDEIGFQETGFVIHFDLSV